MKKIILLIGIIGLLLISGCVTEYENCFHDCAVIKCGYDKAIRATYNPNDICLVEEKTVRDKTIRENCYEECKPQ